MSLKENINRIHFELQNEFADVEFKEMSEKKLGNYFEFTINESNLKLKIQLAHKNLEFERFNWTYLSNPEDYNSIVERISTGSNFIGDVKDIFQSKRFDSDYLKNKI